MVFLKFVGESVPRAPGSDPLMAAGRTHTDPQPAPPGNQKGLSFWDSRLKTAVQEFRFSACNCKDLLCFTWTVTKTAGLKDHHSLLPLPDQ